MDELVSRLDISDFYPDPFRAYSEFPPSSNRYWGVPFESDVMLLLYRKDIFEAIGVSDVIDYADLVRIGSLINNASALNISGFAAVWCTDATACYDQGSTTWNQIAWRYC